MRLVTPALQPIPKRLGQMHGIMPAVYGRLKTAVLSTKTVDIKAPIRLILPRQVSHSYKSDVLVGQPPKDTCPGESQKPQSGILR